MDWRSPCPYFNKECRKKETGLKKKKIYYMNYIDSDPLVKILTNFIGYGIVEAYQIDYLSL